MTPFAFYLSLAVALLAIELIVFQFSLFWFLFISLGALVAMVTALFIPGASWALTTGVFVVSSTLISIALYRPLLAWQKKPGKIASHDALGQAVEIKEAVSKEQPGKAIWSGSEWNAFLEEGDDESIEPGTTAYITRLEGIRIFISKTKK